jgi:hypothetical protein
MDDASRTLGNDMKKSLALGALAALCGITAAQAASDDFNRASLGKKWVVPQGSLYINSDQLQGDSLSIGYYKKSANDSNVTVTVTLPDTALQYGAVASGDIASGNNAFVKIQSDLGDGQFNNAAFYVGNNGGGDFFALSSEIPSPATLSVTFCGTVAKMVIKSAAKTQKYTYDYGTTFPTGAGLGTYGDVALDNYKSKGESCTFDTDAVFIKKGSGIKDPSLAKK